MSKNIVKQAVEQAGSRSELARQFNITPAAIIKWEKVGVPAKRVVQFEKITGIPRQKVRPDIFGDLPDTFAA